MGTLECLLLAGMLSSGTYPSPQLEKEPVDLSSANFLSETFSECAVEDFHSTSQPLSIVICDPFSKDLLTKNTTNVLYQPTLEPLFSLPSGGEISTVAVLAVDMAPLTQYKLQEESYPDYSVGSLLWAKDILQSHVYLQEEQYTEALFRGKSLFSHYYAQEDLREFLNITLTEKFPSSRFRETPFSIAKESSLSYLQIALSSEKLTSLPSKTSVQIPSTKREIVIPVLAIPSYTPRTPGRIREKGINMREIFSHEIFSNAFIPPIVYQKVMPLTLKEFPIISPLHTTSSFSGRVYHYSSPLLFKEVADSMIRTSLSYLAKEGDVKIPVLSRRYMREANLSIKHIRSFTPKIATAEIPSYPLSQKISLIETPSFCLEEPSPIITVQKPLPRVFSISFFHELPHKQSISTGQIPVFDYRSKKYKLTAQEDLSTNSACNLFSFDELSDHYTLFNDLKNSSATHLQITPELFSLALLQQMEGQLPYFASFSPLSHTIFPKTSSHLIDYKDLFLQNHLPSSSQNKPSAEPIQRTFLADRLAAAAFVLTPPESGKHALLYPIAHRSYPLVSADPITGPCIQTSFDGASLLDAYSRLKQTDLPLSTHEEQFLGYRYATHLAICDTHFQTASLSDELLELQEPHKDSLVNIEELPSFISNYLAGIHLLQIRNPSSQIPIIEDAKAKNRIYRCTAYDLANLPSLPDVDTESNSEDFAISTNLTPQVDGSGYIFSLGLSLRENSGRPSIRHRVYFLIDRSSSIERHRFEVFKNAVSSAISFLDEAQLFNIFMFDNKIDFLSPTDLKSTKSSIRIARDFLDKQEQPWLSSGGSLVNLLEIIHEGSQTCDEICSVVILTNGHGLKTIEANKQTFQKLAHTPKNNFFIYTAMIGEKNQLALLDLLAGLHRGSSLHSYTHAAFPRKLSILVKQIKNPIVNDLKITVLNGSSNIKFYEGSSIKPCLSEQHNVNFIGTAQNLEDFDILIQGRMQDRWINIRKRIDLRCAIRGAANLEKELAFEKAYGHIIEFLETDDKTKLQLVTDTLKPFNIQLP